VPTPASVIYRTLMAVMPSLGNVFARRAGEGWNVTQFVRRVAGERAVNRNVIVRTGRVIRRMATVLVAGDLLAQNVKSPALKDITALTVYKSARDVTQHLTSVTRSPDSVNVPPG